MPMEIIIAVVVLVVIALAVIMFTSGSITQTGTQTGQQQTDTACSICKQNYCIGKTAGTGTLPTGVCPVCTTGNRGIPCVVP